MPYKNIVFVKLEKRLLNDYRWVLMTDKSQLLFIKLMLLAAEMYNKMPKNLTILKTALRSNLTVTEIEQTLTEIKQNFPKFKENKHFYYFHGFDEKTNYIRPGVNPGTSQGVAKVGIEKKRKEKKGGHAHTCKTTSKTVNDILEKAKGGSNV